VTFPLHRIMLVAIVISLWLVVGRGLPGLRHASYWQETQSLAADTTPWVTDGATLNDKATSYGVVDTYYSYDTFTPDKNADNVDYYAVYDTPLGYGTAAMLGFLSNYLTFLDLAFIVTIVVSIFWRHFVAFFRDARSNSVESFNLQLDLLREELHDRKSISQIAWRIAKLVVMPVGAGFWTSTGAPGLKRFWRGIGY
jgi:hypothetical protein